MEKDEKRQPFTEHLQELRIRLRNSVIALMLATFATFWFAEELYLLLAQPLIAAWKRAELGDPQVNYGSLTDPFWAYFKLSIYAGVFLASPVIFHQVWRFIAPGLYAKERRVALPFAIFSALCFIGGALFCYFLVFPAAFDFFFTYSKQSTSSMAEKLGFATLDVKPVLMIGPYLDLAVKMLLGFGLIFEMPMLIFFLSYVGLVTHRSLWKFNKYAIVLSFVIGAILTPGPDMVSQLLMAAPMIVLYNMSIMIAFVVTRARERRLATDGQPPDDDPPA